EYFFLPATLRGWISNSPGMDVAGGRMSPATSSRPLILGLAQPQDDWTASTTKARFPPLVARNRTTAGSPSWTVATASSITKRTGRLVGIRDHAIPANSARDNNTAGTRNLRIMATSSSGETR